MSLYLLVTLGKCFIGSFSRNLTPYSIWWQQSLYKWRCKKFSKPPGQRSRGHNPLIMKSQTLALNGLNKSIKVGPLLFTVIKTWKMFLLKMGQMLLQSESICITKWGSFPYHKWGRLYYKLHQVLQSEAKTCTCFYCVCRWYCGKKHNISYEFKNEINKSVNQ